MANRTVVIVDENGRLVAAKGDGSAESDAHYAKFAKRIIGKRTVGSKEIAVLNFGWDGQGKLVVDMNGERGEQIELNAASVVIPENLTVRGKDIQSLIDESLGLAVSETGFVGTNGEITVSVTKVNPESSVQPKQVCRIGLSQQFLDRIDQIENEIAGRLPSNISFGDGLVDRTINIVGGDELSSSSSAEPEVRKLLEVKLGTGLDWEGYISPRAIKVNTADSVESGNNLPVTSDAVYRAVHGGAGALSLALDANGNITVVSED